MQTEVWTALFFRKHWLSSSNLEVMELSRRQHWVKAQHFQRGKISPFTREMFNYIAGKVPCNPDYAEGATPRCPFSGPRKQRARTSGLNDSSSYALMRLMQREVVTLFKSCPLFYQLLWWSTTIAVDYKNFGWRIDMFVSWPKCENIQATKNLTRDISNVTRMINRFGDRNKLLCGVDTLAMEKSCWWVCGLGGGLVCAFPKETVPSLT